MLLLMHMIGFAGPPGSKPNSSSAGRKWGRMSASRATVRTLLALLLAGQTDASDAAACILAR